MGDVIGESHVIEHVFARMRNTNYYRHRVMYIKIKFIDRRYGIMYVKSNVY